MQEIASALRAMRFSYQDLDSELIVKLNAKFRDVMSAMYELQFMAQWGTKSTPEWFDHYMDLYYQWGKPFGNTFWLERGVFSLLAMEFGANVLELCCGGGFNAKFFYSYKAGHIISCDFDPKAILHAQTYNMTAKTQFVLADIRTDMPAGKFDNIIWDGSLPYFSESEIQKLISDITNRLAVNGIFSGYVQCVHQPQYKHEFQSKDDLKRFLEPYFAHVKIFETIYPDRHNLYFYASNGILPFDSDWKHITEK